LMSCFVENPSMLVP